MEAIDILVWAVGGGFVGTWVMGGIFLRTINHGFERIERKFEKIEQRLDRMDQDFRVQDSRLSRIEGILTNKDCCMISDSRKMDKAQ